MPRRSFRYDPTCGEMVEITPSDDPFGGHYVRGDLQPFVSPIDGTLVEGRKQYEAHCRAHNVVPTEDLKGNAPQQASRHEVERERRELRSQLWERVDRALHQRR